jgi:hypothetical protein
MSAEEPKEPEIKTLMCPACKQHWPVTSFECLPLDLRCNRCVPVESAMVLYDKRVQQAGHVVSQLLDANDTGKGLKPLERMVQGFYDAWGGPAALCDDMATWVKDLAATGKKAQAVSALTKILNLHGKIDRMKLEDDWKMMDDETIRATLKVRLMEIVSEGVADNDSKKKEAMKRIMGND